MSALSKPLPRSLYVSALALTLSACSIFGGGDRNERLAYVERPAEALYNSAVDEIERRDWDQAKLLFEEVERQHPFS